MGKTRIRRVVLGGTEDQKGELKVFGGSDFDMWNQVLIDQVGNAQWTKYQDAKVRDELLHGCFAGLAGIAPKDELEGMMAVQMVAAHAAAMECYRRALRHLGTFALRSIIAAPKPAVL